MELLSEIEMDLFELIQEVAGVKVYHYTITFEINKYLVYTFGTFGTFDTIPKESTNIISSRFKSNLFGFVNIVLYQGHIQYNLKFKKIID
jgi:hypothetical protein